MATMMECPECKAQVKVSARQCDSCGADFGAPQDRKPPKQSDAAQYAVIGGVIVAVVALILVLASAMGSSMCKECKGKKVVKCMLCKGSTPKCIECKGTGSDPQTFSTCMRCKGGGSASVCERCRGTPTKACPSCGGAGVK